MLSIMTRTTLNLDQRLIDQLKHLAAHGRESMSRTVNRLLHEALRNERRSADRQRPFRWHVASGAEPTPGFEPADRSYLDLLEETPG
jgi:predicted transcriptional regulator